MTFPSKAIINHDSEVFCFVYYVNFHAPLPHKKGSVLGLFYKLFNFWLRANYQSLGFENIKGKLIIPCSQFSMYESSSLITRSSSSLVSEEYEIAVLSAYIVALAFLRANGKSLRR